MELWALKAHGFNSLADYYIEKTNKRDKLENDFLSLGLMFEDV